MRFRASAVPRFRDKVENSPLPNGSDYGAKAATAAPAGSATHKDNPQTHIQPHPTHPHRRRRLIVPLARNHPVAPPVNGQRQLKAG